MRMGQAARANARDAGWGTDAAVLRATPTFERGMLRAIDETAKSRGLTRSAFLADAARRSIGTK